MHKEYSYIAFTSDDSTLIRRFAKWIKWNWNVEYPIKEIRKTGYTTAVWRVLYYNDPIIGRSESILRSCAQRALNEHVHHANTKIDEYATDWTIWSK